MGQQSSCQKSPCQKWSFHLLQRSSETWKSDVNFVKLCTENSFDVNDLKDVVVSEKGKSTEQRSEIIMKKEQDTIVSFMKVEGCGDVFWEKKSNEKRITIDGSEYMDEGYILIFKFNGKELTEDL